MSLASEHDHDCPASRPFADRRHPHSVAATRRALAVPARRGARRAARPRRHPAAAACGYTGADHLVSALVPTALLAAVGLAGSGRMPRGARAVGWHVRDRHRRDRGGYYTTTVGPSGDDFTGCSLSPGALLVGLGVAAVAVRRTGRLWRCLVRRSMPSWWTLRVLRRQPVLYRMALSSVPGAERASAAAAIRLGRPPAAGGIPNRFRPAAHPGCRAHLLGSAYSSPTVRVACAGRGGHGHSRVDVAQAPPLTSTLIARRGSVLVGRRLDGQPFAAQDLARGSRRRAVRGILANTAMSVGDEPGLRSSVPGGGSPSTAPPESKTLPAHSAPTAARARRRHATKSSSASCTSRFSSSGSNSTSKTSSQDRAPHRAPGPHGPWSSSS